MTDRPLSLLVAADSTVDSFAGLLRNDAAFPSLDVVVAPFDQVRPTLAELALGTGPAQDAALIWTRPEAAVPSFARLLRGDAVSYEADVEPEVDAYCQLLAGARPGVGVFVPTWTRPPYAGSSGLLDMSYDVGASAVLARMNLRVSERLSKSSHVHLLDAERWLRQAGAGSFNPKQWYLAKVAFSSEVFKAAVRDVKAALSALLGRSRKVVVVDLDHTLWGGIVGEVGWENLDLGGHSALGEAFVDFQRGLLALKNRGILLAIASKNDESVALEALRRHPEMVLRPDDFAAWRIDWGDKAKSLEAIADSLNLGLSALVFIDDTAFERQRVREALPEVLVPEWPESPMLYRSALAELRCLDQARSTDEDRRRHEMYATERRREQERGQAGSIADWLKTLEMEIEVEPLGPGNRKRAVQLLNKTNQMNLKTRRMTEGEFEAWLSREGRHGWAFRVSDRFGDAGLTALLSVEDAGDARAEVMDFVVSCRVFHRGVEEAMLSKGIEFLRGRGARELSSTYEPTEKNRPCAEFWGRSGFRPAGDGNTFVWDLSQPYACPGHIRMVERAPREGGD